MPFRFEGGTMDRWAAERGARHPLHDGTTDEKMEAAPGNSEGRVPDTTQGAVAGISGLALALGHVAGRSTDNVACVQIRAPPPQFVCGRLHVSHEDFDAC